MKKKVTLNVKEQKRLLVLNKILAGQMTGQEAAEMLGLSLRHTRRLITAYRKEGGTGQGSIP
jgi:transposase